jgi:hypothetical protein
MFLSTFEHVWSSHARLEDGSLELKELSRSHVRAVPCSCVWHPMAGGQKVLWDVMGHTKRVLLSMSKTYRINIYGFCFDFLMDFGGFLMHEPSHFAARCSPAWSSWMVQHSGDPVEKVLPPSVTRAVQLPKHLGLSEHWKTTILIVYPLVMTNSLPWYCIDGPNRNRFGKHSVLKNGWIFAMLNNHLFMTCYHPSRPLIHMCWFGQSQSHMTICSVYDVKFRCSRYFPYVTFSPFSGYSYMNNELWSLFHAAFGHLQRA